MRTRIKISLGFSLLILSVSIFGQTRSIVDMGGRKVDVPLKINRVYIDKHCAMMVNAIAPEMTVNMAFNPSDEAKKFLPATAYEGKLYTQGNKEEILKLHPDIVFMADELNPGMVEKANKLQEQIKLPVVLVEMNMAGYKKNISFLGDLLGKKKKADELLAFIKKYIDPIEAKAKTFPSKSKRQIYYAEGENGLKTDPSGSKHSQSFEIVGANNIAKADIIPGMGMSTVSMEQVLVWNPEVIFAQDPNTYKFVLTDNLWKGVKAVQAKKVYKIPNLPWGWIDRPPGTNRILGTIWLANVLYPKVFKYNMVEVTREYFRLFYHLNLTVDQAKVLINPQPKI